MFKSALPSEESVAKFTTGMLSLLMTLARHAFLSEIAQPSNP